MPSIKVNGMSCQHCVASVTKALEEIETIHAISIDLKSGLVHYEENGTVDMNELKNAILKIGFTPEP